MSRDEGLVQESLPSNSPVYRLSDSSCPRSVCEYLCQLENDIRTQTSRIGELEQLLSSYRDKLDDESIKRELLELELNQHKEALLEKAHDLKERDQTIDTQNCLLGFAWTEAQDMATAQRERDRTIGQLRCYINDISSGGSQEYTLANESKKRKLFP